MPLERTRVRCTNVPAKISFVLEDLNKPQVSALTVYYRAVDSMHERNSHGEGEEAV